MRNSREWKRGRSKEITFIVTKDCQLACRYCYQVGKNSDERLSWETSRRFIDYVLTQEIDELLETDSVIFTFIGGEPFLEIDLIDKICDYLKMQMYLRNHRWFNSYRFAITTNGINYDSPKVQNFIKKNIKHLSLTVTIDGTQRKHDLNRIWKTSSTKYTQGSYNDVVRNIPLWLDQFPNAATKVTISSEDIPYVCESVLHLYSLGIRNVYINCVFENVWNEGDDKLLEEQLFQLADVIISQRIYKDHMCSMFERWIGKPIDKNDDRNWCGAGRMLGIDKLGFLYPCIRFAKYSLRDKSPRIIGDIQNGIDRNLLRPYYSLSRSIQSDNKCMECQVASGCAWCQAENYDSSDGEGTIFHRSTAICKMHKARVRANDYYWEKIDEIEGNTTLADKPLQIDNINSIDKSEESPDTVIVLLSSASTAFCHSDNPNIGNFLMPLPILKRIVDKAEKEDLDLMMVFPENMLPEDYHNIINSIAHKSIAALDSDIRGDAIVINGWDFDKSKIVKNTFYILRTTLHEFYYHIDILTFILHKATRLNIIFTDEASFCKDDETPYGQALATLARIILKEWTAGHQVSVNIVTDRLQLIEMDNCNAGWKTVTLAPNGKYYICPDFYYSGNATPCGDIFNGLDISNPLLYKLSHAPLCKDCGAYQCQRCVFLNREKTLEVNTPSFEQCDKSRIELEATMKFFELWMKER